MRNLTRRDVLDKCIVVFEAIRRAASKGNAGMEPAKGAEESFAMDTEILDTLREMVRELEAGEYRAKQTERYQEEYEKMAQEVSGPNLKNWQMKVITEGPPQLLALGQEDSNEKEDV